MSILRNVMKVCFIDSWSKIGAIVRHGPHLRMGIISFGFYSQYFTVIYSLKSFLFDKAIYAPCCRKIHHKTLRRIQSTAKKLVIGTFHHSRHSGATKKVKRFCLQKLSKIFFIKYKNKRQSHESFR